MVRNEGMEGKTNQKLIFLTFTPLEIMPPCSATGLNFSKILAGFNAPLEFLTGFTKGLIPETRETFVFDPSAAPNPAFQGGVRERRSGSTLSKPWPSGRGVEGLI
jgi:hypothetical protein